MIATAPQTGGFKPESKLYRSQQHLFRGSLGRFATGVAVVTFDTSTSSAQVGRGRHGITVNSFTSVSMDPPLVLVSIAHTTNAHDQLEGRPFTVNVLGAEQEAIASHFAGKPGAEPLWVEGDTAPRLSGVLSYFQCTPWATYPGGDHTLFLGEVQDFDYRAGDALGFVNGRFTTIPEYLLGHEALL
ncbi:flavin reductase family protein [Homoserinimonas sp. A447]